MAANRINLWAIASSLVLLSTTFVSVHGAAELIKYNIDPATITVSGISSGGGMATQFHFAYSNEIHGAGIFAGIPYLCAYKSLISATACTLSPSLIDISGLMERTEQLVSDGDIEPTANINGSRVYIWQGKLDPVVKFATGGKIQDIYERYGATVHTEFSYSATHGQPTDDFGAPCGLLSPLTQFINNCHYKGAFEMLNSLYEGNLNAPSTEKNLEDRLLTINQRPFFNTGWINGMANLGYLYVPSGCKNPANQCRLHIAFHGCMSNVYYVGNNYATKTGYIEAAESNNIIILFPQADLTNPMGCWDWFGYLGFDKYPTKGGPQMRSVHNMLNMMVHGLAP